MRAPHYTRSKVRKVANMANIICGDDDSIPLPAATGGPHVSESLNFE